VSAELEARIARLESIEEIRQLVSRYAEALDRRDVEAMASLFVSDVAVGNGEVGRDAFARWLDPVLRPYRITFHLIGNHVIDLVDESHATGIVYCRPEHEVGDEWIVMPMQYWDRYERDPADGGAWRFRSRAPKVFYAADVNADPKGVPGRYHFPGNPMITEAQLPERHESWRRFWGEG
jgi:hypothetical protein